MDGRGNSSNDYHFITHWRVPGDMEAVAQILSDAPGFARWWPSVYLDIRQLTAGDEQGIGKVVDLFTKGWLPYTLRWRFRVTEVQYPRTFTIVAEGDFVGRGIWTLAQDGDWVRVDYDWRIRAEKPLLRYGSWIMKPIFAANHRWAMARGEESLRLELARRAAASPEARSAVAAPPAPTSFRSLGIATLALGLLLVGARVARDGVRSHKTS